MSKASNNNKEKQSQSFVIDNGETWPCSTRLEISGADFSQVPAVSKTVLITHSGLAYDKEEFEKYIEVLKSKEKEEGDSLSDFEQDKPDYIQAIFNSYTRRGLTKLKQL